MPPPLPLPHGGNYNEETAYAQPAPPIPLGPGTQTRILTRDEPQVAADTSAAATVLVRPAAGAWQEVLAGSGDGLAEGEVVGWLVVIDGPGRGRSVALGYGMNSIGRGSENRVILSFGDPTISRIKHAILTYDPRGRRFYLNCGDSSNLTYLGETPVLSPVELKGGETLRIGNDTLLKFVPFCGDNFDWND